MFLHKRKLATLLVLLALTFPQVTSEEIPIASRNHKAMRAFDGRTGELQPSRTEVTTNANEDQVVDEDEEQDHYDEDEHGDDGDDDEAGSTAGPTTTPATGNYVATTPKIVKSTKVLSRYEQGLEDYEEAAQRVEQEQLREQKVARQQQLAGLAQPFMTLFSVLGNALSSGRSMQVATGPDPSWFFGGSVAAKKGYDGGFITKVGGKSTSSDDDDDAADNQNANSTTSAVLVPAVAKEEGRYIKGDPLNGYYDFVISEGSYKFWAAFQVATAVLIIYSTFAAIYYSKVSPLTSDYDYIDYLNGGRSFAGGRSMVGPAASARGDHGGSLSWQDRMLDKPWFNMAAQSFAFVMDAIERAPK